MSSASLRRYVATSLCHSVAMSLCRNVAMSLLPTLNPQLVWGYILLAGLGVQFRGVFSVLPTSLRRYAAMPPARLFTLLPPSSTLFHAIFYGGRGYPFVFIGVYSWFALRRSLNRQPSTLNGLLAETHGKHSRTQSKHRSNPEEKHSKRQ